MTDLRITTSAWMPLETGLEEGRRIAAVGDSHGKSAQLKLLLDYLEACLADEENSLLVFLGDLVDRGEDSIGCLDAAINANGSKFGDIVYLMGNHEQMLLLTIRGEYGAYDLYCSNGGGTLLEQLDLRQRRFESPRSLGNYIALALGHRRVSFLEQLHSHFREANLLFVHAGIDPYSSLEEHLDQPWHRLSDYHWSWIRFPFLQMPVHIPGLTVVHGHTPARVNRPDRSELLDPHYWHDGKINIDGGSFVSGCVAAADFISGNYRILVAS